ncbi:unnamed protein product [Alopecurus aequalis]
MATKKHHTSPVAVADPKFELAEKAGTYVLRLALPGFRKDDFRVQVDGAGRLTVRGTRTGTAGPASLHKVFQLPSAANHDNIAGKFEAGVLTLTVPKRAASTATAPTSVEEKQPAVKEEVKPKAPQAATAPPREPAPVKKKEEMKPKAPKAAAAATAMPPPEKPEAATSSEKAKAVVAPDSLAERVRRRGEEECAKAAAVAAEKEAKTEQEKKATADCWKRRAMGELKGLTNMKWAEGLTDMKWADGVVETARNNKEVVAVCIAAFSVGFLVSQKLFRK